MLCKAPDDHSPIFAYICISSIFTYTCIYLPVFTFVNCCFYLHATYLFLHWFAVSLIVLSTYCLIHVFAYACTFIYVGLYKQLTMIFALHFCIILRLNKNPLCCSNLPMISPRLGGGSLDTDWSLLTSQNPLSGIPLPS